MEKTEAGSRELKMTMSQPSLAIIIVNWNSYVVTKNCLSSLREINYSNYKVIVVDNGSDDDSGDELKAGFPEITLLKNAQNLGFTGGNNKGIAYAIDKGFELVMLLNNDTVVTSDFASTLVNSLMADDKIGAIQPKILFNKERDIIWNGGNTFSKIWHITKTTGIGERDNGQYNMPKEMDWVTGCCFLTRVSIVKEVGLLDDQFFIYYEDADWSFRIRNHGYRLTYEPSSWIYHDVGKSNENRETFGEGYLSPFSHYVTVRNHIFLTRRYSRGIYRFTSMGYQVFKIAGYLLYFLVKGRFKKMASSVRGFYHGLTKKLNSVEAPLEKHQPG